MTRLLERELDDGGYGFSTGLIYQPGKYATSEEVLELTRAAANKGAYYSTHMRSEGDEILESIDEVINLAKETGIRAEISHLKTSGKNNCCFPIITEEGEIAEFSSEDQLRFLGFSEEEIEKLRDSIQQLEEILSDGEKGNY